MKLDKEMKKINSEALFLFSSCFHLFLQSLAQRSAAIAREKKRKTLKLDHLQIAVKRHRSTSEFLFDSLHATPSTAVTNHNKPSSLVVSSNHHHNKLLPTAALRIDHLFHKQQQQHQQQIFHDDSDVSQLQFSLLLAITGERAFKVKMVQKMLTQLKLLLPWNSQSVF